LLIFVSLLVVSVVFSQTRSVTGTIQDDAGAPIPGARISIKGLEKGAVTNARGVFTIKNLPLGSYQLRITANSYDTLITEIALSESTPPQRFVLKEKVIKAGEVVVTGKSEAELKSIEPIKADVIDFRITKQEASSVAQVMNRTAGMKMRSAGGVGSGTEINLNGLQGKRCVFSVMRFL
jgi:hypothetical protein